MLTFVIGLEVTFPMFQGKLPRGSMCSVLVLFHPCRLPEGLEARCHLLQPSLISSPWQCNVLTRAILALYYNTSESSYAISTPLYNATSSSEYQICKELD